MAAPDDRQERPHRNDSLGSGWRLAGGRLCLGPMSAAALPPHLVLYDGVCGFCNASIQFIVKRDPGQQFHFAPLQGATAAALRLRHPEIPADIDTVVLVEGESVYLRSDAAFRIAGRLPGPVSWLRGFGVLPRFLTDFAYGLVARVRYRIFGQLETCPIPSKEQRSRFLD